jgi:hypothetical protein
MTYDPILNITSGIDMVFQIFLTTLQAVALPLVSLVLYPLQSVISFITAASV